MVPRFYNQLQQHRCRPAGSIVALLFAALVGTWLTSCANVKKSEDKDIMLGLRIVQLYKDGVHFDTVGGERSVSFSEAKAEVTTDNYRGRIVRLGFPNSHEIAGLKPNDVIKIRMNRRIVEEHLEATKDPAKAYSHLNSPDFTVTEINGVPR